MAMINRKTFLIILSIFLFSVSKIAECKEINSSEFYSRDGFSVKYPKKWIVVGKSDRNLQIISGGTATQGSVVPQGKSEIIVRKIVSEPNIDLLKIMTDDFYLENAHFENPNILNFSSEFDHLKFDLIGADFTVVSGHVQEIKIFYCRSGSSIYTVMLVYWKGSPVDLEWYRSAISIMKSLRTKPYSECRN